eukprot:5740338-Prymnesium_polylepis.1
MKPTETAHHCVHSVKTPPPAVPTPAVLTPHPPGSTGEDRAALIHHLPTGTGHVCVLDSRLASRH